VQSKMLGCTVLDFFKLLLLDQSVLRSGFVNKAMGPRGTKRTLINCFHKIRRLRSKCRWCQLTMWHVMLQFWTLPKLWIWWLLIKGTKNCASGCTCPPDENVTKRVTLSHNWRCRSVAPNWEHRPVFSLGRASPWNPATKLCHEFVLQFWKLSHKTVLQNCATKLLHEFILQFCSAILSFQVCTTVRHFKKSETHEKGVQLRVVGTEKPTAKLSHKIVP